MKFQGKNANPYTSCARECSRACVFMYVHACVFMYVYVKDVYFCMSMFAYIIVSCIFVCATCIYAPAHTYKVFIRCVKNACESRVETCVHIHVCTYVKLCTCIRRTMRTFSNAICNAWPFLLHTQKKCAPQIGMYAHVCINVFYRYICAKLCKAMQTQLFFVVRHPAISTVHTLTRDKRSCTYSSHSYGYRHEYRHTSARADTHTHTHSHTLDRHHRLILIVLFMNVAI
jgi:hypothetical protein